MSSWRGEANTFSFMLSGSVGNRKSYFVLVFGRQEVVAFLTGPRFALACCPEIHSDQGQIHLSVYFSDAIQCIGYN